MAAAKKVLVPIANGSEEIETVSIIDTLRRAGAEVTGNSQVNGPICLSEARGNSTIVTI